MMIIDITQKLLWLILKPTLGALFKFKVEGEENLENIDEPIIVALNHKSALDAFLFGVNLKFNSPIWPMRFISEVGKFHTTTLNILNRLGIIRLAYFIFGHFLIKRGAGFERNIKKPVEFLKKAKKGSVCIFIEGERVFNDGLGKPRKGTAAMSLASGRKVLPVAIRNSNKVNVSNFRRKEIIIHIGKAFHTPDFGGKQDTHYKEETFYIMDKIKDLYLN